MCGIDATAYASGCARPARWRWASARGRSWEHSRFAAPALRDTLFDTGVLAETLETAATWTALPAVYAACVEALHNSLGRAVVGCHVSHLYPTGASLYFTVLAAADAADADAQWLRAKKAANDAITLPAARSPTTMPSAPRTAATCARTSAVTSAYARCAHSSASSTPPAS